MKPSLLDNGGRRLGVDSDNSLILYIFLSAGLVRKEEAGLIED